MNIFILVSIHFEMFYFLKSPLVAVVYRRLWEFGGFVNKLQSSLVLVFW